MTPIQEAEEIITNAKAAYQAGEITADQFIDATREPIKYILIHESGMTRIIEKSELYIPHFARAQ